MSKQLQPLVLHKRWTAIRVINRIVHWGSLFFLGEWAVYGAFRCPFVVPFVSCQNCPVITCPGQLSRLFWSFWGGLAVLGFLCGRAFCGWFCPGGLLNRLLAMTPLAKNIPDSPDRQFAWGKIVMLVIAIWVYYVLGQPRVNVPIRIGEFVPAMLQTFEHSFPMWQFRFGIVVAALAGALLVPMLWCRYLCPLGGLLEIITRWSPLKFHREEGCNECGLCRAACHMNTTPGEPDCTNCGDCVGACPKGCIRFGHLKGK